MVNISKNKLSKNVKTSILSTLTDVFLANTSKRDLSQTIFEILSPSERIMLAKRVSIIAAILRGNSSYEISLIFKVSTSTVAKIENDLQKGKFKHIEKIFKRKRARESFLGALEQIITFGLPGNVYKRNREKLLRDIDTWKAGGR